MVLENENIFGPEDEPTDEELSKIEKELENWDSDYE